MAKFMDRKKIVWSFELNVGMVIDIKTKTGTDLNVLLEKPEEFAEFLRKSPEKLVEMLWIICEEQIMETGTTPEKFGKGFDRPTLDAATDALIEAIVTFYPRTSAGNALRKKLPQIMKKMDMEIEKEAEVALDKILLDMPTG